MSKTNTNNSDACQRIVETAERLFYAEGVRAVGLNRIIAEAKVAKMTLYHHFPSKDDLISPCGNTGRRSSTSCSRNG